MSGRRSATIIPSIKTLSPNSKMNLEDNQRICLKLILAALIPLMIGVFTIVSTLLQQRLSLQQREQDKQESRLVREQSERLAENLQKETILVTYLNDVSQLLMSENRSKTLIHIRTKTLTSLRQLDPERKRYVFLFLYESELIDEQQTKNSIFFRINGANFNGIIFNGTNINKCTLVQMSLSDIYLSNASFIDCYIDRSNFSSSTMYNTMFWKGRLIRVSFKSCLLDYSGFREMKLTTMNFRGASLVGSNFTGAIWDNTSVDFTNANLTEAILSDEQLRNSILKNCLLPNRTWGPIETKNLVDNQDLQRCIFPNDHIVRAWNISSDGNIEVFRSSNQNISKCYFRTVSFNNPKNIAFMIQIINLEDYTRLISSNNARYHASATFQCLGVQKATMTVQFIDLNGLRQNDLKGVETERGTHLQWLNLTNILRFDFRHARILITFFRSFNENDTNATIEGNYCACYNIVYSVLNDIFPILKNKSLYRYFDVMV